MTPSHRLIPSYANLLWCPPVLQTLAYLIPVVQQALERRGLLGDGAGKGGGKRPGRTHSITGAPEVQPATGAEAQQGRAQPEDRRQQQRTVQVGPWMCIGGLKQQHYVDGNTLSPADAASIFARRACRRPRRLPLPPHRHSAPFPASFCSPAASLTPQECRGYTGRSNTFLLPSSHSPPQALIVAPSRELCIQIQRTAQQLLPLDGRKLVAQAIGGANPKRQAEALGGQGGVWPLLVVGTPGRVAELVAQGALQVWSTPVLVLDEVRRNGHCKDW